MTTMTTNLPVAFNTVSTAVTRNDVEFLTSARDILVGMIGEGSTEAPSACAFLIEYIDGALEYAPDAPVRTADRVTVADARAAAASIANGYYTITLPDGGAHVTIRISDDFRAGSVAKIAGYLAGADNEHDYINFAFIDGGQVRPWSRFRNGYVRQANAAAVVAGSADRADLALAFAQASGRCARCGRTLTVPASLHAGYGPDCYAKLNG